MLAILCSVLGLAVIFLSIRLFRIRRILGRLEAAVRSDRRLLAREAPALLERTGLGGLVREINGLIDRALEKEAANTGYSNQVEATLGEIREAVIIFSADRTIEYANESARRLFQQNRPLRGLRLESAIRSPSLIEFLDGFFESGRSRISQLCLDRKGEDLWFEGSLSEVRGISAANRQSTLLVLHDITQLKRLEMVRRDFVANVSHELRTPLTIIKGFAETLVEDNESLQADARARFLDKIVKNAQRLHVLVEDLLTLSRLESKPEQVVPRVQCLKTFFEEVAETYRGRIDSERQAIVVEVDPAVEAFAFDRFRINQVVDNLIENAFRYAPEFTRLGLTARYDPEDNVVDCAVTDDGPGIPKRDLEHIFERFYRVDKGRSRERGGTGLGLSIMKHIVQLHGGSVRVDSEEGRGTAIHFRLPYARDEAEGASAASAAPLVSTQPGSQET